MIERGRRPVKYGFGFYLSVSLFLHLVLLIIFSNITFPEIREETEEILPVAIRVREPLAREVPGYLPEWLDAGEFLPVQFEERVADLARLPASFRWAPSPPGSERVSSAGRVPRPEIDREDFTPPDPDMPEPEKETREVPVEEVDAPLDPDITPVDEPEEIDDFLAPGEEVSPREERQLLRRPSFPHARLRDLFPDEAVRAGFELTVAGDGQVVDVEVVSSTENEQLDTELAGWINNWIYNRADQEDTIEVEIEIPAE